MINLEIGYMDRAGNLAVTTVEAKSINHIHALYDGEEGGAAIDLQVLLVREEL